MPPPPCLLSLCSNVSVSCGKVTCATKLNALSLDLSPLTNGPQQQYIKVSISKMVTCKMGNKFLNQRGIKCVHTVHTVHGWNIKNFTCKRLCPSSAQHPFTELRTDLYRNSDALIHYARFHAFLLLSSVSQDKVNEWVNLFKNKIQNWWSNQFGGKITTIN